MTDPRIEPLVEALAKLHGGKPEYARFERGMAADFLAMYDALVPPKPGEIRPTPSCGQSFGAATDERLAASHPALGNVSVAPQDQAPEETIAGAQSDWRRDDDARRVAQIKLRFRGDPHSFQIDEAFLLRLIAERDAEIARLRAQPGRLKDGIDWVVAWLYDNEGADGKHYARVIDAFRPEGE